MGRLSVHAGLYCLLLALVSVVVPLEGSFGSDDGAYGGQVHALRQGSWALERPLAVVPEANEGWLNTSITPAGPTPYTANPAYARLLEAVVAVVHGPPDRAPQDGAPEDGAPEGGAPGHSDLGTAGELSLGLHLPGMVAALVSAAIAWRVAARWDRRASPLAFWILGLGPVLVNTTALWAHPLSTAATGAAVLATIELSSGPGAGSGSADHLVTAATRAQRCRPWLWRLLLVVSLVVAAGLRTEAAFFTMALVGSALVLDRSRTMTLTMVAVAAVAVPVAVANRAWGRGLRSERLPIETSIEVLEGSGSWFATRVPAAWQLLVTSTGGTGAVVSLAAAALAVHGAVHLRRGGGSPMALASLGGAAALYLVKTGLVPSEVIPGLIGAWPVVAVGLVVGRRRSADTGLTANSVSRTDVPSTGGTTGGRPDERWLLVPCAGHLAAVLITQYASSGGLQWGGRYLSMIYVPLAAMAAVRLLPHVNRRPLALGVVVALAVTPAMAGVATSRTLHRTHAAAVAAVTAEPAEVVITEMAALPRIAWTALPTAFYRADAANVEHLLVLLAGAGVDTVNVQGMDDVDLDGVAGYRVVSIRGEVRHLDRRPTPAGPVTPSPGAPAADP